MSAHHCSLFDANPYPVHGNVGEIPLEFLGALPSNWSSAIESIQHQDASLSRRGERILVLAAGPLVAAARAFAMLREEGQWGMTDAMPADEPRVWRDWDRVIAISAAGHEPELLHAMRHLPPRVNRTAICADAASALVPLVDDVVVLPTAVATSILAFETTTLVVTRFAMGADVTDLARQTQAVLSSDVPSVVPGTEHVVFVGSGWAGQVAQRCAQAVNTAGGIRSEAYPLRDARYGAIDHAGSRSLVWFLGKTPADVIDRAVATGAVVTTSRRDPIVDYVEAHRMVGELRLRSPR